MRNTVYLFAAAFALSSCTETKKETVKGPEGFVPYALTAFGKPFVIDVPDTSSSNFSVTEEASGDLHIVSGKNFDVRIRETAEDLVLRKEDVTGDEVNRLANFIQDDSTTLVWESSITKPEFHFVINRRINGSTYAFEDNRESMHAPFTKEAVMRMKDACSACRPVE